jgi:two-component system, NarL family, nitrate/nitrite response regulator NarL
MTYSANDSLKLYVAEEQELYHQIYQSSFSEDKSISLLGIPSKWDEQTLPETLMTLQPDVLILGIKTLDDAVCQKIVHLIDSCPNLRPVILLTGFGTEESKSLRRLIQKCRRGISIYLKQSLDNHKQLQDIVHSVNRGQVILDPVVANSILNEKLDYPFMKLLTEREMEILNLLSLGHTNHGIANALGIDIKTVAHHLNSIYSKFKDDRELSQMHPRVSVARLYLKTTGELLPFDV